jgi:hypothetical protein
VPQPQFPIYIPTKGRHESRVTIRLLQRLGVPFFAIVEAQEADLYAAHLDRSSLLILDPEFQRTYDTCDDFGGTKSRGSGPARNFAWAHAQAAGAAFHWVIDDNINNFYRLNRNTKIACGDGTPLRVMEDFVFRYQNVAMAGPQYEMFAPRKSGSLPPFVANTRLFSCNLIRTDAPFRWRGRYNEDLDLSLRMLKAGWCTIQFNAFLQDKIRTQAMKGGNTDSLYAAGTEDKSAMIVRLHPDVARLAHRFGRAHHFVDFRPFRSNRLIRKPDLNITQGVDEYGMAVKTLDGARTIKRTV